MVVGIRAAVMTVHGQLPALLAGGHPRRLRGRAGVRERMQGMTVQIGCREGGAGMQTQEHEKAAKYLRVKVVDHTKEGRPAVNIKVPIGVVKWGMKMAQAFSPQMKDVDLDWDSIDAMVHEGETGKIVEVEDEAEHKTIEVCLE
jgi:hypothetical protein